MTDTSPHLETLKTIVEIAERDDVYVLDRRGELASLAFAIRAIEERDELYEALRWLVHVGHGVGKAGHAPEPGEFEAAMEAGEHALAAKEGSPYAS